MLELKDILNITPLLFILNITILTNFIGDTLRLIGFINYDIIDEIYVIIK